MNVPAKQLFDIMTRHGIGLDPWFFERSAETPAFPPHNIVQRSDNEFVLTLALAGFERDEIDISLHADMLTITGTKTQQELAEGGQMLYRGIALRDFSRQFKVGEHVSVERASLLHGMLQIDLIRTMPETAKAKRIAIA
jgi:molecular chaperone IbpA